MKVKCYVIVSAHITSPPNWKPDSPPRVEPGPVRMTKKRPRVESNEVPIRVDLEIPDSYFYTPTLAARIELPETKGVPEIETSVVEGIERAVREYTGLTVHVSAPERSDEG